ncbi:hypothetical protein LSH36_35g02082 [Paralvinella palmiformis]|uniref:Roadblock/LAMTOR2 domain-containing protein n=1 Tax=Paralvinella palmiformis TaxID=53620 RepID=A0AAD9NDZ6_9ANNE|nr:hypothetical protein LSH36_35g02082 [Paralvinella palmiformis]
MCGLFMSIALSPGRFGAGILETLNWLINSTTTNYVTKVHQLVSAVRNSLHELDPTNDLSFLRIRSKKHELLIAPDKEYMLIVIQQPSVSK